MPPSADADEPWPRGRHRHGGVDRVPLPTREAGPTGALWLAGKRYVAPDADAALQSIHANTAVCLCEDFEIEGHWPAYVEWLRTDPRAIWAPIHDFGVAPVEEVRALMDRIAARLDAGEGVLVHCGAGIGRAGTVAAAVLMHYGLDMATALEQVAAARPGAGPQSGLQTELLEQLQDRT